MTHILARCSTHTIGLLALLGMLAACATSTSTPPDNVARAQVVAAADTARLWATYRAPGTDEMLRRMTEAELAARGQTRFAGTNLGAGRTGQIGVRRYAREASSSFAGDRDCADFSSGAEAQRFFLAAGGPTRDPHDLDRDGDGFACEWGTELRGHASRPIPAAPPVRRVVTPRRTASRTCHVGPRGGTYTITASGNRNYGGC